VTDIQMRFRGCFWGSPLVMRSAPQSSSSRVAISPRSPTSLEADRFVSLPGTWTDRGFAHALPVGADRGNRRRAIRRQERAGNGVRG
jgi:hypothetical protein